MTNKLSYTEISGQIGDCVVYEIHVNRKQKEVRYAKLVERCENVCI